ncbi:hypothetical protein VIBNIPon4_840004 [Vibrio nigripulchritudo POn4]|nr:hypothetical protein VIBNIPon4_840004 [Vibrio nigripulchritudo POn4]
MHLPKQQVAGADFVLSSYFASVISLELVIGQITEEPNVFTEIYNHKKASRREPAGF